MVRVRFIRNLIQFQPVAAFIALAICAATLAAKPAMAQQNNGPWWKHAVIYEIYPRSFQDSNADGVGGSTQKNDLFYVPIDQADFSFAPSDTAANTKWGRLDDYINNEPCLKDQRGRIMERTSCRNPWINQVNARLAWSVATYRGQRLELTADIFNVLHLLNNEWGLQKQTSFNETTNIVRRVGFDATNQRNTYDLRLPIHEAVNRNDSRSRVLLGARYTF